MRLKAEDWARVTWRPRAPVPQPRPFDFEIFVRHAQAGAWMTRTGWERETAPNPIPALLTKEEAWFWLKCISIPPEQQQSLEPRLRNEFEAGVIHDQEIRAAVAYLAMRHELFGFDTPQTLAPFIRGGEIAALIIRKTGNAPGDTARYDGSPWPMLGFASCVAPYLPEAERSQLRERLERAWDAEASPDSPRARMLLALLATLGGGERLAEYLKRLPDGAWAHPPANPLFHQWRSGYLDILAGLPDEASFVSAARRLGCLPRGPADIRLWLAATQWRQLDAVRDAAIAAKQEHEAATLVRLLGLVEAPETACAMLEAQLSCRAPEVAADWLDAHPQHTAAGLAAVAMGESRLAQPARMQLQRLQAHGHCELLAAIAPQLPPAEAAWLQREILASRAGARPGPRPAELPAALRLAFAGLKPARHAPWLRADSLPPIRVAGRRLIASQITLVLTALHDTPLGTAYGPGAELLEALKAHAQPATLDAFVCQLFELWSQRCFDAGEEWCLAAVGHLGGDGCVWQLAPLLHAWAGQQASTQAMYGLACLGAIGSPTALMAIEGVSRRHRASRVKLYAQGILRRIAAARGLSRDELIDLSVPDCGFSAPGGRKLDYGPRQLQVVLGPQLTPLVRDSAGKLRSRPPLCGKGDDSSRAKAALLEWQVLKKTLQEVRDMQVARLEDAMVNGRRWHSAQLMRMAGNPVMSSLLRCLVLGSYGAAGTLLQTFRVTEDLTWADCQDHEVRLPEDGPPHSGAQPGPQSGPRSGGIGVVHPAHLDDTQLSAWGQLLGDYEIIPPFAQLGREVHRADPTDLTRTEITRHRGVNVPDHVLRALLAQARFVHDTPSNARGFLRHSRYYPGPHVTAVIRHVPVHSALWHREVQRLDAIYFVAGTGPGPHLDEDEDKDRPQRLTISAVDTGVLSEVLRLVHAAVEPA